MGEQKGELGRLAKRNRQHRNPGGYGYREQLEFLQKSDNWFSRSSDYASLIRPTALIHFSALLISMT